MAEVDLKVASISSPETTRTQPIQKAIDGTCAELKNVGIGTGRLLSNVDMPGPGAISITRDQFSCLKPEVAQRLNEIGAERVEISRSAEGPRISLTLANDLQIPTPYDPVTDTGQMLRVNLPRSVALTIKPNSGDSVEFTNIENISVDANVKMSVLGVSGGFTANGVSLRGLRADVNPDGSAQVTPSLVYLGKAVDPKAAQYPADAYNKLYSDFLVLGKILG